VANIEIMNEGLDRDFHFDLTRKYLHVHKRRARLREIFIVFIQIQTSTWCIELLREGDPTTSKL